MAMMISFLVVDLVVDFLLFELLELFELLLLFELLELFEPLELLVLLDFEADLSEDLDLLLLLLDEEFVLDLDWFEVELLLVLDLDWEEAGLLEELSVLAVLEFTPLVLLLWLA